MASAIAGAIFFDIMQCAYGLSSAKRQIGICRVASRAVGASIARPALPVGELSAMLTERVTAPGFTAVVDLGFRTSNARPYDI